MKKNRYFWVFFSGTSASGEEKDGRYEVYVTNGTFVNELGLIEMISKYFNVTSVYIKDVRELNEEDFNTFAAGRIEDNGNDNIFEDIL